MQVVYAVANEGSRLEIPDGPLGRLISGEQLLKLNENVKKLMHFFMIFPALSGFPSLTRLPFVLGFITDCWTEPDDRPSCEEILSRLLDCEYSLC